MIPLVSLMGHDDWFFPDDDAVLRDLGHTHLCHADMVGVGRLVAYYKLTFIHRRDLSYTAATRFYWWRFSRKHERWVFIGHIRPDGLSQR